MTNIFGMLNIANSALMAQQKAIDVTGNNISNVNTEGYTRQRLNIKQGEAIRHQGGTYGGGVTASRKIQRMYDQFVSAQINGESENFGRWEAEKQLVEKVEILFNTTGGSGIDNTMADFFNAWQDLINNPSGAVERDALVNNSIILSESFSQLDLNLKRLQNDADAHIDQAVVDINREIEQLYNLNEKIVSIEIGGHSANEYRDERDLLIKELSSKIDVNSFEDSDGFLVVTVAGGKTLVDRGSFYQLSTQTNANGFKDIFWTNAGGASQNITSSIQNGKLKGWINTRDNLIDGYLTELDTLAQELITRVNTVHATGFALDGSTGRDFFLGSDAATIEVNTDITGDPSLIATSGTAAGVPGDNSKAIEITELQNGKFLKTGTATFDEFYSSLVAQLGSDTLNANNNYEHETLMVEQLEFYREEVSGVSLDEEMVNLVKFQHAYSAAAKLVTTVDQMLDSLIAIAR